MKIGKPRSPMNDQETILNLSEDHVFRQLVESSEEGMMILNTYGEIMMANSSCLRMFGYEMEALIGQRIEMLFPQGHQIFYHALETDSLHKSILDGLHKQGQFFPISISISQTTMGEESLVIGYLNDATERLKAEQERAQFSRIFDESLNEIYVLDFDSWKFLSVNKGALRHLGYSLEEMKEMSILDINPDMDEKEIRESIFPLEAGLQDKIHFETTRRQKNGDTYPVEVHLQLTNYFSKKAFLVIAVDISERKKMQQKLMGALVEGQEKERKRIAKELHDGLGQNLSAVNFNLNSLEYSMHKDEANQTTLKNMRTIIENSVNELKSITQNLHPRILENYGLPKAIESLCENISQPDHLEVKAHIHGLKNRLSNSLELGFYRIAQELINNMLKHANASEVNVHLNCHHSSLILMVEDNGLGFEMEGMGEYSFEGFGIRNIITQVEALNGTYHFDSKIGIGTSVTIEAPLIKNYGGCY